MAISVTHPYVATGADDPTKEVNAPEWNAAHTVTGAADLSAANIFTADQTIQSDRLNIDKSISGLFAPGIVFKGFNGVWLTGMDNANNGGSCDYVLSSKGDVFGPGTWQDHIYIAHNGAEYPTVGIGITPPTMGYQLQIGYAGGDTPTMGQLELSGDNSQTQDILNVNNSNNGRTFAVDANCEAKGGLITGKEGSSGAVSIVAGDATGSGYVQWFLPDGTAIGYLGYAVAGSKQINMSPQNGGSFTYSGNDLWHAGNLTNPASLSVANTWTAAQTVAPSGSGKISLQPGDGTHSGYLYLQQADNTTVGYIGFAPSSTNVIEFNGTYAFSSSLQIKGATTGGVVPTAGDTTHTGYVSFARPDGSSMGYMGFGATSDNIIHFNGSYNFDSLPTFGGNKAVYVISKAGAPTTTDVPAGEARVVKDTTGGTVKLFYNDGGTLKSVALV